MMPYLKQRRDKVLKPLVIFGINWSNFWCMNSTSRGICPLPCLRDTRWARNSWPPTHYKKKVVVVSKGGVETILDSIKQPERHGDAVQRTFEPKVGFIAVFCPRFPRNP